MFQKSRSLFALLLTLTLIAGCVQTPITPPSIDFILPEAKSSEINQGKETSYVCGSMTQTVCEDLIITVSNAYGLAGFTPAVRYLEIYKGPGIETVKFFIVN